MKLLDSIRSEFPHINFIPSDRFSWSPENQTVFYDRSSDHADWSLMHEIGHVLCGHSEYSNDLGLLKLEVEAWEKARELSNKYRLEIDPDHIEKCLDSYREWLYKRSSCPNCTQAGVEKETGKYQCINCRNLWSVSPNRFCRVYRKTVTTSGVTA